jgi:hypothetical protein
MIASVDLPEALRYTPDGIIEIHLVFPVGHTSPPYYTRMHSLARKTTHIQWTLDTQAHEPWPTNLYFHINHGN